jgi:hypothetical protein
MDMPVGPKNLLFWITARTATAGSGREIEAASQKLMENNVSFRLARARLELSPKRDGRRIDPVS